MTIVSYVFFSKFYNFTFYMKICKLKCAFVYCDSQKLIYVFLSDDSVNELLLLKCPSYPVCMAVSQLSVIK